MLISSLPTSSDTERKTLVKSSSSNQYIRVPILIRQTISETALQYELFWTQRLRKSPPAVMSTSHETPCIPHLTKVGWDSVLSMATCYVLDGLGIKSQRHWVFLHSSKRALGPTQPPAQGVASLFLVSKLSWVWLWPATPI